MWQMADARAMRTIETAPWWWRRLDWKGFAVAVGVVLLTTAACWPIYHRAVEADSGSGAPHRSHGENVLMIYLLGVLWVATHHSRSAAVLASLLAVCAYDLIFVPPFYTFAVSDQQYIVTFAVMLATALVISALTHRVRQHSEEARQAWERVEAEFLRNTLLSGVSHDLRTPLSAITGAASTLIENRDQLSDAAQSEMLDTIYGESERMERLINNLLDMTRVESGGLQVRKEWQPLQEVVGSVLHRIERRLGGRKIRTDLPADLPLVQIDSVLIGQVLMNLLDNAIAYTPPNSTIEIRAREMRDPREIEVEVADNGPGIPPGTETRVFQKFFRAAQPEKRQGIGLGLAICRGIIDAHGGMISARNAREGGAVFRFTIPMTQQPPPMIDSMSEREPAWQT
jgi:K+-sensing histidine kinase KdpD